MQLFFISWPVPCKEHSRLSELGLGSRAALTRQKSEGKAVKTTAENRIIKAMLDQCSPHSRFSWTQWEAPRAGDHSSVGTEATVTKQSCSHLPSSIKISFYGTLYTWPFEQSVTINGACILEPNLGKEQEIICLAGRMEREGPAVHNYLCPLRDTGKWNALRGLPGPPQNGALNDIDVVLMGARFVFSVLHLRARSWHLESQLRQSWSL